MKSLVDGGAYVSEVKVPQQHPPCADLGGGQSMAAATAWRRPQHGGGHSMAAATAWRRPQHGGGHSMAAATA